MQQIVFCIYYLAIIITLLVGITTYKRLDVAMHAVVMLMAVMSISELISYVAVELRQYAMRYAIYHFYSIIEIFLQSLFFIYAIKPHHYKRLVVISAIVWPIIGFLNMVFLQPWNQLNNNMLMLESFATITMSLYFIYWLLKNDKVKNIFRDPHFWMAVCFLILWSVTFFFWAFIKILYRADWPYSELIMYIEVIINTCVFIGMTVIFLTYPQKLRTIEKR